MREPKKLLVSGVRNSGKTALCLALALILREQGLEVGYFKPIGWQSFIKERAPSGKKLGYFNDVDAVLMKEVLKLKHPLEYIVPVLATFDYLTSMAKEGNEDLERKIEEAYRTVSEGVDVLIIEGGHIMQLLYSRKLSNFHLAKKFNTPYLITSQIRSDLAVDDLIFRKTILDTFNINFIGAVLNNIPRIYLQRTKDIVKPILEKNDIKVWGIIEENRELTAPSVADIQDLVEGELIEGPENLDDILVEDILVGSMTAESAIKYFRRGVNKAVVMGGDREDVALAALETNTSVLILTGNLYPTVRVLSVAKEKNVPVILVPYDTYTTICKLEGLTGKLKPTSTQRIKKLKEIVEKEVDWKGIYNKL
ncbi:MAG: phosphotransacetylase family protein [Candidatus Freyarchaeota archaeon]|nr:phosphotransacetylase family protein [Candidatus Jordarchaeia archaeon]MBS7267817.1 phosphotransacetylase family protein [Candidatus Jordarchaeia archaeon]MBS7280640.1 phosphotransacetylase family protein [Candidatus Jordarchaeia archaeon]